MSDSNNLLIHALAIHPEGPGVVRARVTIRLGEPAPGDRVWFAATDRVRRELEIVDIRRSDRLSTVSLRGSNEVLSQLVGGTYLYGMEGDS